MVLGGPSVITVVLGRKEEGRRERKRCEDESRGQTDVIPGFEVGRKM